MVGLTDGGIGAKRNGKKAWGWGEGANKTEKKEKDDIIGDQKNCGMVKEKKMYMRSRLKCRSGTLLF